jgi:hypothetical protein
MKIPASTRGHALIDIAAGASVSCLAWIFLLFFTSLGDFLPSALKIALPVSAWVVAMWFFFAHRTSDGGVEYETW